MPVQGVEGDLLDQRVDRIVNAWNRNIIPYGFQSIAFPRVVRSLVIIVWILVGSMGAAAELKPVPDLNPPSAGEEKRATEIREVALRWWLKNRGLLAEESVRVAGYFHVTRPISGFAARNDRVWEVRVVHLHSGGPSGVLWIHDKTERVIGLGVPMNEKTEPDRPANGSLPVGSESDRTSSAAGSRR